MKQLLFICTFLLLCINSLAEEVVVELYRSYPKDKIEDNRSITLEPIATIDGNTIRIYSDVTILGLQISIIDSLGNIVYSYNDMTPSQCYTFDIHGIPEEKYILELKIEDDSFYGYFYYLQDI